MSKNVRHVGPKRLVAGRLDDDLRLEIEERGQVPDEQSTQLGAGRTVVLRMSNQAADDGQLGAITGLGQETSQLLAHRPEADQANPPHVEATPGVEVEVVCDGILYVEGDASRPCREVVGGGRTRRGWIVKLGIGLPTHFGNLVGRGELLRWAQRAEAAGFHSLVVHDRPNHETWDPLATLAAVGAVTERIRLLTGALLLPPRDEALVAKQAAVVDVVSGGRLDLGLALGGRSDDFELFGRSMAGRGRRFEAQLERLSTLWASAIEAAGTGVGLGPAPVQRPRPPLWIGGYTDAAIERAVRFGDGYIFGAPGPAHMSERVPIVRRVKGKPFQPGETRPFRLPFDNIPSGWNQVLPQLVIARIDFEN